jgi:hypothetical protein
MAVIDTIERSRGCGHGEDAVAGAGPRIAYPALELDVRAALLYGDRRR